MKVNSSTDVPTAIRQNNKRRVSTTHTRHTLGAPDLSEQEVCTIGPHRVAVPNIFGTRDWFHGRKLFHRVRWGREQEVELWQ